MIGTESILAKTRINDNMAKIFSEDNKSVRVTGGDSFNFDEFRKRSKQAKVDAMAKRVFSRMAGTPEAEEKKTKNRAKAKKAMKKQ